RLRQHPRRHLLDGHPLHHDRANRTLEGDLRSVGGPVGRRDASRSGRDRHCRGHHRPPYRGGVMTDVVPQPGELDGATTLYILAALANDQPTVYGCLYGCTVIQSILNSESCTWPEFIKAKLVDHCTAIEVTAGRVASARITPNGGNVKVMVAPGRDGEPPQFRYADSFDD